MLGLSRWTTSRRIKDYGLEDFRSFSKLPDDELDELVDAMAKHCCRADKTSLKADERLSKVSLS